MLTAVRAAHGLRFGLFCGITESTDPKETLYI